MTGAYMATRKTKRHRKKTPIVNVANESGQEVIAAPLVTIIEIPHEKQLMILYFLYDAFQRAMIDWFLIRQTAKDAMSEHQLTGDHVEIGVRKNEWDSGKGILLTYFDEEHVKILNDEPDILQFEYQEVPFILRLYEDSDPLMALVPIQYEHETFLVPNQFERFEREFDKKEGDLVER